MSIFHPELNSFNSDGRMFFNCLAKPTYWAGRWLIEPMAQGIALVERPLERSMKENVHGRHPSENWEIARRVCWVATGLFLCLIGAPLFCLGAPLLILGSSAKADMTYIQPENDHKAPPLADPLRMITFNLGALPEWITVRNQLTPVSERIDGFIEYLQNNPDKYHCIALQELFDQFAIAEIVKRCRNIFPYMLVDVAPQIVGMNSGLAILSKFPLNNPSFRGFKDLRGDDAWANKGVLRAKVDLGNNNHVVLFNAHLQAGYSENAQIHRKSCLDEIETLYDERVSPDITNAAAVYTMGDLNITYFDEDLTDDRYKTIFPEILDLKKFFRELNYTHPLILEDGSAPEPREEELDAISSSSDRISERIQRCGNQIKFGPIVSDSSPTNSAGTCWRKDSRFTLWNMKELNQWNLKQNRVDFILQLKIKGKEGLSGGVGRNIEIGKYSDHAAIEGEFPLSLKPFNPSENCIQIDGTHPSSIINILEILPPGQRLVRRAKPQN